MPIDALSVLCAQLTRDLLAIAKFLLNDHFRCSSDIMITSLFGLFVATFGGRKMVQDRATFTM